MRRNVFTVYAQLRSLIRFRRQLDFSVGLFLHVEYIFYAQYVAAFAENTVLQVDNGHRVGKLFAVVCVARFFDREHVFVRAPYAFRRKITFLRNGIHTLAVIGFRL